MIEPLAPELKALFEEERSSHPDRSELRERVRTKIETSIALGAGIAVVGATAQGISATSSSAAVSPLASFGIVKAAVVSFVVGGLFGGSTVAIIDRTISKESHMEVPSLPERTRSVASSAATPLQLDVPLKEEVSAPSASTLAPSPKQGSSTALQNREVESAWLAEAKSALLRGNADEALTWVAKHKANYPDGALREEREVLAIQALVSSNRRDEARQRADQFRLRFAKSTRMNAVEAALREKP